MSTLIYILVVLLSGAFLYTLSGLGKLPTKVVHTEESDRTGSSRFRTPGDPLVRARGSRSH